MVSEETPLTGGRTTPGVVRVGDTVRRPTRPNAPLVRRLLVHLESVGFPHTPRFLGTDDRDRDVLSYVEGTVPDELGEFTEEQVAEAARILRAFHDASRPIAESMDAEVICHGDASPCNYVFMDRVPVALIDFDTAHPGPRSVDVGYAAWLWLDIGNPELDPRGVRRQLRSFMVAYGDEHDLDPIPAIVEAQDQLAGRCDLQRESGPCSRATHAWTRRCRAWVLGNLAELTAALP